MKKEVTANLEQKLYWIPCGKGFSCMGFEYTKYLVDGLEKELKTELKTNFELGSIEIYKRYKELCTLGALTNAKDGFKSNLCLNQQLLPYKGKVIECEAYGQKLAFKVGMSMGWMPCLLEIEEGENGGCGIGYNSVFSNIKVIS